MLEYRRGRVTKGRISVLFCTQPFRRPHRLTVRTPASQAVNRGSIPRGVTNDTNTCPSAGFVLCDGRSDVRRVRRTASQGRGIFCATAQKISLTTRHTEMWGIEGERWGPTSTWGCASRAEKDFGATATKSVLGRFPAGVRNTMNLFFEHPVHIVNSLIRDVLFPSKTSHARRDAGEREVVSKQDAAWSEQLPVS